jgi:hypothetical protein
MTSADIQRDATLAFLYRECRFDITRSGRETLVRCTESNSGAVGQFKTSEPSEFAIKYKAFARMINSSTFEAWFTREMDGRAEA